MPSAYLPEVKLRGNGGRETGPEQAGCGEAVGEERAEEMVKSEGDGFVYKDGQC